MDRPSGADDRSRIAQALAGGPPLTDGEMRAAAGDGLVKARRGAAPLPVKPHLSVTVDTKTRTVKEFSIGVSGTF